jgi:hypothetical protein
MGSAFIDQSPSTAQFFKDLEYFPHKSAFAWRRAGSQVGFITAILRAFLSANEFFVEYRPLVKIHKTLGFNGKRSFARVVEEKQTMRQCFKVGCVTNKNYIWIIQKPISGFPGGCAKRADFKRSVCLGRFLGHMNLSILREAFR